MCQRKIRPSRRSDNIKYAIRDIITLAEKTAESGKEMFYLNIGDPNVYDFSTPSHIVEAACKALRDNLNGYAPSSGIETAREAIREDAGKKGIKNILDVFVTTGAAEAIEVTLTALLNTGDNFLMPTPGYPLYTAIESKLECQPNPYYLDEANGWQVDTGDIRSKINSRTKAIVLINPNNPTGSLASRKVLEEIVGIAAEHNLVILADEIYDKLIFEGGEMISIASINPDVPCITFSGMSKNFMVPGWRVGWGIISGKRELLGDYIEAINKILRSRVSANHPLSHTIAPALIGNQSHLKENIAKLESRNKLVSDLIKNIDGINLVKPQAAFYAFPSIDVADDWDFCKKLIKETGVVTVPGDGFGQRPGSQHFRIVLCASELALRKSFELIADFYGSYKQK